MKNSDQSNSAATQSASSSPAPPAAFDRTLLAMMLRLTPEQRLEWLNAQLRAIEEVRRAVRA